MIIINILQNQPLYISLIGNIIHKNQIKIYLLEIEKFSLNKTYCRIL